MTVHGSTPARIARLAPKCGLFAVGLLLSSLLPASETVPERTPEHLVEEGLYLETARWDLAGAMRVYERALRSKSLTPRTAACARLRLAVCARLSGDDATADNHLRAIVEELPAERDFVRAAQALLGKGRKPDPARFMPPDTALFVELVEPARHVEAMADLVEGTAFQNPLDDTSSYVATGTDGDATADRTRRDPGPVEKAAAILNRGFLNELQKVEGLAIGFPGPEGEFLLVLFPGQSDVLRGLLTALLSVRTPIGFRGTVPIYEAPFDDDPPSGAPQAYVAYGDDFVLWGSPRHLVEEAVERHRVSSPSLADGADFQGTLHARARSMVFSYLGRGWMGRWSSQVPPTNQAAFQLVRDVLELDRVRLAYATLSLDRATDTLVASIHASLEGVEPSPFWSSVKTPPIPPDLLHVLPADSTGHIALALDRADAKWRTLVHLVEDSASVLPGGEGDPLVIGVRKIDSVLTDGIFNDLLRSLRALALSVRKQPGAPPPSSLHAVLEFEDAAEGESLIRRALTDALRRVVRDRIAIEFRSARIGSGNTSRVMHYVEPFLGSWFGYVRIGDRFVVALSPTTLARAVARKEEDPSSRRSVPEGTCKSIFIGHDLLADHLGSKNQTLRRLLTDIEINAILTTREADDLSLDLRVPKIRSVARAALDALAGALDTGRE